MGGPALPTNIDASYPGSTLDPSADIHQQHHDVLHRFANRYDVDAVPGDGQVLTFESATNLYKPKTPAAGSGGSGSADLTNTPYFVMAANGGTGAYPDRPATTRPVVFRGVTQPPTTGSTSGGQGMVVSLDEWRYWSSGDVGTTIPDGSIVAAKFGSSALDSRLRVDAAQTLDSTKRAQAKSNLGLVDPKIPFSYTVPGTVTVGAGVNAILLPAASTLDSITVTAGTAPTGSTLIVDVNKGTGSGTATSVFSTAANKPTLAVNSTRDTTPGTDASTTAFAAGDFITVDIDQIGSTTAGADLTITIWLRPA